MKKDYSIPKNSYWNRWIEEIMSKEEKSKYDTNDSISQWD